MRFSAQNLLTQQGTNLSRVGMMNGMGTKYCTAYEVEMDSTIMILVH